MKRILFVGILICSMTLITSQAFSLKIALYPSGIIPAVGACRDVGLWIVGLNPGGPPSLGAFDTKISFNDSIVALESVTFFDKLGDPDLDQGPGWTSLETDIFVDSSILGEVRLMETSLLSDVELDALQGSGFCLARLRFRGVNIGYNNLELQDVVLSDAFGSQLLDPILENAFLHVVVPEPASFILLILGLIGGVGILHRRSS